MITIFFTVIGFLLLTVFYTSSGVTASNDIVIIIAICTFGAFALDICCAKRFVKFRLPILIGILFRFIIYVWYAMHPATIGDQHGFFIAADTVAKGGVYDYGGVFTQGLALLYRCVGTSWSYSLLLISIGSCCLIIIATQSVIDWELEDNIAYFIVLVVCVLPYPAYLGSQLLREVPIQILNGLSAMSFVRWFHSGKRDVLMIALAIILSLLSSVFHSGSIALAIGYLAAYMLFGNTENGINYSVRSFVTFLLLVFALAYLLNRRPDLFLEKMGRIDDLADIGVGEGRGGSSYAAYVGDSSSITSFIKYTPLRMLYFYFAPVPWTWRGLTDAFAFFCATSFYLVPMIISTITITDALLSNNKCKATASLFICLLLVCFIFGWGCSNSGTAMRHREKFIIPTVNLLCAALFERGRLRQ